MKTNRALPKLLLLFSLSLAALVGCGGGDTGDNTGTSVKGGGTQGGTNSGITQADLAAPTQPLDLQSGDTTRRSITLSWTPSSDNIAVIGYHVLRDGIEIAVTSTPSYLDEGLNAGVSYHYTVTAVDAAGNVSPPSLLSTSTLPPLTAPGDFLAHDITKSSLILSWAASTDTSPAIGYKLFRDGVEIADINATTYQDQVLIPNTTYSYTIQSYDAVGSKSALSALSANTLSPLLATLTDFEYIGGFNIPNGTYGDSRAGYAEGRIALGANHNSIFLVGHAQHHAVAEFSIPALVNSTTISSFNKAANLQPFSYVLDRAPTGNTQGMNRIGGMALINGSLVINAYEYYDAAGDATHTTLVLHEADKLSTSSVSGYDGFDGRAHAAGWLSAIPSEWQGKLQGSYLTGFSSGFPIISRTSVGPSAFAFYPEQTLISPHAASTVVTTKLLDFNLTHPVGYTSGSVEDYLWNVNLNNKLWTHLSGAAYGFIIPGTRSYMVVGGSGGHDSGIGYKITQDNGTLCGGYCSYAAADNYGYYWIFDVDDLLKVSSGELLSYEVTPYEYGKFIVPIEDSSAKVISGGAFDEASRTLYLSVKVQQGGEPVPVIVAYKVKEL